MYQREGKITHLVDLIEVLDESEVSSGQDILLHSISIVETAIKIPIRQYVTVLELG